MSSATSSVGKPPPPPKGPKRSKRTGLIFGSAVVVVAALGGLTFVLSDDSGSSESGGGGGTGNGGGQSRAAAEDFLDAINRQDEDTATGMVCSNSEHATDTTQAITNAIATNANLQLDRARVSTWGDGGLVALLDGTVDGGPITTGQIMVVPEGDAGWCVNNFYAQWM